MTDNNQGPNGATGLLLGVCAVVAALFLLTGGEFGGNKKVRGDQDLPPIASPAPPSQH